MDLPTPELFTDHTFFKIYNPIEFEEDKALILGTQGSVFSLLLQSVSSLEMMNDQLVRFCQFNTPEIARSSYTQLKASLKV